MLNEEKNAKLTALINEAEENGEEPDFIQNELIPAFKAKHDVPETAISEPVIDNRTQYEKSGIAGALFPATASGTERGGNAFTRAIAVAGDILTYPARAIGGIAAAEGTRFGGGTENQARIAMRNEMSKTKSDETKRYFLPADFESPEASSYFKRQ